ncbi:Lrp/AsnC family transcriptional regulator [Candidatus Woesearchaeota archaeon]|nr:MAG: Lrp/AsnC family transcriptional regulator, leucine-responsive regulatory protein [archaeon GW2011_AR4]MBS3129300.1 Lrp/AsnC family transcriptional regulator [Candidatus Woesearchaeota archaeon]HIH38603.1 Lrp/AsnC family transcriptional regulator [Candidatus Woesearchaeota archaeon]HIH48602.1 Lrp/AsnC family transcriptional regulator [Candidatus Woesearchaeota archaeon]HIJ02807.1 Lrp/AsnC family transcriptional regulator [Candidatus Woesearchaeota archaeon]
MSDITDLDQYDRRLLYELDKDSSTSLPVLAKTLKRSKQFILYRMKRLEQSGVITGYHAIIDMAKLGYFTFRVYVKFQQMTKAQGELFVAHVRKHLDQVWTITSMHGKWDYALFLGVRRISEFHTIWDQIMLSYKEHIKKYNVAVYAPIINFNRMFFYDRPYQPVERVYGDGDMVPLKEHDWEIIELFANNVRLSSLAIAQQLKMSADTVRRRIKELEKTKIIVGYKIGLGLEQLGYAGYRVDLELLSTKRNKEIFEYCKQHKNIYQINRSIGGADFEIEVIVKNLPHLLSLIDEMKQQFPEVIRDVDYFGFSTFHILKYIPD